MFRFAILLPLFSFLTLFSADDLTPAVQPVLAGEQDAGNRRDLETSMSGYWNSPSLGSSQARKKL